MQNILSITRYFGNKFDRKVLDVISTVHKKKALSGSNVRPFRLYVPSPTLHDMFVFWGTINV